MWIVSKDQNPSEYAGDDHLLLSLSLQSANINSLPLVVSLIFTHLVSLFKSVNKENHIIDLNNINDMSGIILFKPTDKPILIDMMNIDTELGFYFNNKN